VFTWAWSNQPEERVTVRVTVCETTEPAKGESKTLAVPPRPAHPALDASNWIFRIWFAFLIRLLHLPAFS
jgi:hypothetical protein